MTTGISGNTEKLLEFITSVVSAVAVFLVAIILSLGMQLYLGVVTYYLLNWFLTPALGVPAVGYLSAVGINLLLQFIMFKDYTKEKLDRTAWIGRYIAGPAIYLLIGYIIHLLV